MEPKPNPEPKQPAPIMDVAPPPRPAGVVAEPPKDADATAAQPTKPVAKSEPEKQIPVKPAKTSHAPVLAIFLALLFFVVLSAAAYYAYTKSN